MPFYYDNSSRLYLHKKPGAKRWNTISEGNVARKLRLAGRSSKMSDGYSEVDRDISTIIDDFSVDIAGAIAGYMEGYVEVDGCRILVTSSPNLLTPTEGEWPFIRSSLETLMSPHPKQYPTLISWLSLSCRALYLGERRYGQVPFIIGPQSAGKSFLQVGITKPLLGGRSGKIWPFLSGETQFNKDLIRSEFLYAEDPPVTSLKDRAAFANRIKQFAVAEFHQWRSLFNDGVTINPFWRLMISSNSELHNLGVIPNLESSIRDRIHVFLCAAHAVPPPAYAHLTEKQRKELTKQELPFFLWHLLNEWKVPAELNKHPDCERFGLDGFQHPEIVELVQDQAVEFRMLRVVEETHIRVNGSPWLGTSVKLLENFGNWSSHPEAARFSRMASSTIGDLLSKLHEYLPERIKKVRRTKQGFEWVILPETNVEN